jgi:tryptophan-rich sensory protein
MERRKSTWKPIVAAGAAALFVSMMGLLVTNLSPWYYGLIKPSWQPPDWLFGPVWTTIFALAAIAGVLAWRQSSRRSDRIRIIAPFAVNAALNVLWSWLFFTQHRPDRALIEVVALWLSIAVVVWALWPLSRTASWLIIPYLVWVSFAAFLNLTIVQLNSPFTST